MAKSGHEIQTQTIESITEQKCFGTPIPKQDRLKSKQKFQKEGEKERKKKSSQWIGSRYSISPSRLSSLVRVAMAVFRIKIELEERSQFLDILQDKLQCWRK